MNKTQQTAANEGRPLEECLREIADSLWAAKQKENEGENDGSKSQDQRENETPNASQDDSPSASEVKGIFKSTKRPQQPDQQNQGQADKQERETSQDNSPPTSEVRQSLDSALESLDDALTGNWPVEDTEELDRILIVAEDVEKKVAEITAKAKELLADVEEPEAVSSVD